MSGKHQEKHIVSDSEGVAWTRAVEVARGLPEGSLTPVFKIRGQGSVHESITEAAAKRAGVPFSEDLKKGVRWPDVPSESAKNETDYPKLIAPKALGGALHVPGTITHDSHYGSKQYWHSMVPNDGNTYTNKDMRELIVQQAVTWYEQAQKTHNIFHLGKALHMVQDSYSASHVIRDQKSSGIVSFQSYDQQDPHKHGDADRTSGFKQGWEDIPGTHPALQATTRILEMYNHHAPSKELEHYLKSEVFVFSNGDIHRSVPDSISGGSDPTYRSDNHVKTVDVPSHHRSQVSIHRHRAQAYADLPQDIAIIQYPELAGFYAARQLISQHVAGHEKVMARFDENAIKSIERGELLQSQQYAEPESRVGR